MVACVLVSKILLSILMKSVICFHFSVQVIDILNSFEYMGGYYDVFWWMDEFGRQGVS